MKFFAGYAIKMCAVKTFQFTFTRSMTVKCQFLHDRTTFLGMLNNVATKYNFFQPQYPDGLSSFLYYLLLLPVLLTAFCMLTPHTKCLTSWSTTTDGRHLNCWLYINWNRRWQVWDIIIWSRRWRKRHVQETSCLFFVEQDNDNSDIKV